MSSEIQSDQTSRTARAACSALRDWSNLCVNPQAGPSRPAATAWRDLPPLPRPLLPPTGGAMRSRLLCVETPAALSRPCWVLISASHRGHPPPRCRCRFQSSPGPSRLKRPERPEGCSRAFLDTGAATKTPRFFFTSHSLRTACAFPSPVFRKRSWCEVKPASELWRYQAAAPLPPGESRRPSERFLSRYHGSEGIVCDSWIPGSPESRPERPCSCAGRPIFRHTGFLLSVPVAKKGPSLSSIGEAHGLF